MHSTTFSRFAAFWACVATWTKPRILLFGFALLVMSPATDAAARVVCKKESAARAAALADVMACYEERAEKQLECEEKRKKCLAKNDQNEDCCPKCIPKECCDKEYKLSKANAELLYCMCTSVEGAKCEKGTGVCMCPGGICGVGIGGSDKGDDGKGGDGGARNQRDPQIETL